ncbi:MAG: hypothetical protein M3176_09690, partial [Chloroflexota bacterium]|nr:hypothetical protein [Chloroflexota bacterium]
MTDPVIRTNYGWSPSKVGVTLCHGWTARPSAAIGAVVSSSIYQAGYRHDGANGAATARYATGRGATMLY